MRIPLPVIANDIPFTSCIAPGLYQILVLIRHQPATLIRYG